jgi:hypothetical protein
MGSAHMRIPRYVSHARLLTRYDWLEARCRSLLLSLNFTFDDGEEISTCHEVCLTAFEMRDVSCYLVLTRQRAIVIKCQMKDEPPCILLCLPLSNILSAMTTDLDPRTLSISFMPTQRQGKGKKGGKAHHVSEGSGGAFNVLRLIRMTAGSTEAAKQLQGALPEPSSFIDRPFKLI